MLQIYCFCVICVCFCLFVDFFYLFFFYLERTFSLWLQTVTAKNKVEFLRFTDYT